jgi:membrane dipeptidase
LRWFDLHCDTLTRAYDQREDLLCAGGHVALNKARADDDWTQVYAIFLREEWTTAQARAYFDCVAASYARQRGQLDAVCRPILAVENAGPFCASAEDADALYAHGVRILSLTWNGGNALAKGNASAKTGGLTPLGVAVARRALSLGMTLDASHIAPCGFWDLHNLAGGALIASHSCCAAVHPHPRNLDDEQIRALIASGGLIGLNFYPPFLGGSGGISALARHLRHILDLGGGGTVALGTDFDGCEVKPCLAGMEKLPWLRLQLAAMGFAQEELDAFFFRNAQTYFGF